MGGLSDDDDDFEEWIIDSTDDIKLAVICEIFLVRIPKVDDADDRGAKSIFLW